MSRRSEPLWTLPSWGHLSYSALLGIAVTGCVALIFGGADYLTAMRTHRVRLHLDVELELPFIPAAVVVYLSIYPLCWLAPFALPGKRQVEGLACTLTLVTLVGGLGFLAFPADSVFPPPGEMGIWTTPVGFAKTVALQHNMMPSLHVAMSVACACAYGSRARLAGKFFLGSWAGAIALSTFFLHQHYLADVLAGLVLGLAGYQWVYRRWTIAEA